MSHSRNLAATLLKAQPQDLLPLSLEVLRELPIPSLDDSPQGRSFHVAAEVQDARVASSNLVNLVCSWKFVPITLCGLTLNLSKSFSQNSPAATAEILLSMLDYVDFPVAA